MTTAEAKESAQCVRMAVDALPSKQRVVITALYIKGMTYDEAARATGIKRGMVYNHETRAIDTLRGIIGES